MGFPGPLQGGRQRRRIEQKVHETPLIFDRKADDTGLFDCLVRGLLGGGNDEIADAAALHFSSALHHSQRIGAIRASIRALRLCSLGIIRPLFPHSAIVRHFTGQGQGSFLATQAVARRYSLANGPCRVNLHINDNDVLMRIAP